MDLITDAEVGCLEDLGQLDGVGFKTILAKGYWRSARITEDVIAALEASTPLAPMHNPRIYRLYPCFPRATSDNPHSLLSLRRGSHQTIPDYAAEFGVPRFWVEQHDIRRYGYTRSVSSVHL